MSTALTTVKALRTILLGAGFVRLGAKQAQRRIKRIRQTGFDGIWELLEPQTFKAGEVLGLELEAVGKVIEQDLEVMEDKPELVDLKEPKPKSVAKTSAKKGK